MRLRVFRGGSRSGAECQVASHHQTRHSITNLSRCTRAVKWSRQESLAPAFPFSELPALCIIIETSLPRLHSFLPSPRYQATRQPSSTANALFGAHRRLTRSLLTPPKISLSYWPAIYSPAPHTARRSKVRTLTPPSARLLSPKDVLYTNNPIPIAS